MELNTILVLAQDAWVIIAQVITLAAAAAAILRQTDMPVLAQIRAIIDLLGMNFGNARNEDQVNA